MQQAVFAPLVASAQGAATVWAPLVLALLRLALPAVAAPGGQPCRKLGKSGYLVPEVCHISCKTLPSLINPFQSILLEEAVGSNCQSQKHDATADLHALQIIPGYCV